MSDDKPKRRLGRGMSALFGESEAVPLPVEATPEKEVEDVSGRTTVDVPVEKLRSGRYQPRMDFDDDALQDLADSIRAKGIIQPILVRRLPEDPEQFEIIAGERRWRAAQRAQVHVVPVLVREFTDQEAAEVALIENLQRRDLSPLEEAEGYRRLIDEFQRSQEDLAQALGKSRSHVANMIRLLALPKGVKDYLRGGQLTAGHARALLNADQPEVLAEQIVTKGLNVRQTEKLVTDGGGVKARKPKEKKEKDSDTLALEKDLARSLGLKVEIDFQGRGGYITIHYDTLEQLDDILARLNTVQEGYYSQPLATVMSETAAYENPVSPFLKKEPQETATGLALVADAVEKAASFDFEDDHDDFDEEGPAPTFDDAINLLKSVLNKVDDDIAQDKQEEPPAESLDLEDAADALMAELAAEAEEEKRELLTNPYADEEGEFTLDPEDEDESEVDLDASADALMAELAAETEEETRELLTNPYADEEGEFTLDPEDEADSESETEEEVDLDASADALMAELAAETAEETRELLTNPYADEEGEFTLDPEDEAESESETKEEVDLDASADALMAELAAETEEETRELLTNPYADEEGEFTLDPEDEEDVAPVSSGEAEEGFVASAETSALLEELTEEIAQEAAAASYQEPEFKLDLEADWYGDPEKNEADVNSLLAKLARTMAEAEKQEQTS